MTIQSNQTAAEVFSAVLHTERNRCARAQVEQRLGHVTSACLNDAILALVADGALIQDGEDLHVPFTNEESLLVERLAGVVNVILVTSDLPALTFEQVCAEAERDPDAVDEQREVLLALVLLDYCGLAKREDEDRWRPTRAAVWAERLSF